MNQFEEELLQHDRLRSIWIHWMHCFHYDYECAKSVIHPNLKSHKFVNNNRYHEYQKHECSKETCTFHRSYDDLMAICNFSGNYHECTSKVSPVTIADRLSGRTLCGLCGHALTGVAPEEQLPYGYDCSNTRPDRSSIVPNTFRSKLKRSRDRDNTSSTTDTSNSNKKQHLQHNGEEPDDDSHGDSMKLVNYNHCEAEARRSKKLIQELTRTANARSVLKLLIGDGLIEEWEEDGLMLREYMEPVLRIWDEVTSCPMFEQWINAYSFDAHCLIVLHISRTGSDSSKIPRSIFASKYIHSNVQKTCARLKMKPGKYTNCGRIMKTCLLHQRVNTL